LATTTTIPEQKGSENREPETKTFRTDWFLVVSLCEGLKEQHERDQQPESARCARHSHPNHRQCCQLLKRFKKVARFHYNSPNFCCNYILNRKNHWNLT